MNSIVLGYIKKKLSDFKERKKMNENGSRNLILNNFKVGFFKKLVELHNFKKPTYLK